MRHEIIDALARRDGFSSTEGFFYFFQHTYREEMLDDFEIVHWDPLRVEVVPGVMMFRADRMWAVRGTATPYKQPFTMDMFIHNIHEVKHETR